MKTLLITGGGTGGHVSPGLGVAQEWSRRQGPGSVAWVGKPGGIEAGMAQKAGLSFHGVESAAFKRKLTLENLAIPGALLRGFLQAKRLLKEQRPDVVLMTGGYVGLPLSLAAAATKTPLVLMEANAVPGLANRLLKPLARRLCLAYAVPETDAKLVVTGTPCRLTALPEKAAACKALGLDAAKRTLLVMPGSQAAKAINLALADMLETLGDRADAWQWIWMAGRTGLEGAQAAAKKAPFKVQVHAFIDDVATAYAASDLVLCRSGASTLAELGVAAKASLQIPYPYATGNHQSANARAFAEAGAASVMDEKEMTAASLEKALRNLLDGGRLEAMSQAAQRLGQPKAAVKVADVLEGALQ